MMRARARGQRWAEDPYLYSLGHVASTAQMTTQRVESPRRVDFLEEATFGGRLSSALLVQRPA